MTEYTDLGQFILAKLQATAAVTELIVGGAARVLDADSSLLAEVLSAAQSARRDAEHITGAAVDQVLAVMVLDTGEVRVGNFPSAQATVMVMDRGRGYSNIRIVREQVIAAVINCNVLLARDAYVVGVRYGERSGFLQGADFDVDYENVDFFGPLTYGSSSELYT